MSYENVRCFKSDSIYCDVDDVTDGDDAGRQRAAAAAAAAVVSRECGQRLQLIAGRCDIECTSQTSFVDCAYTHAQIDRLFRQLADK